MNCSIAELQDCRKGRQEGTKYWKEGTKYWKGPKREGFADSEGRHGVCRLCRNVDKTAEDLKVRTKRFAVAVLEFAETLPRTPVGDGLVRQLIRAGTGVAGNYRSSCRARSHAEFTARLGIVLEEADESELWLDVCDEKNLGNSTQRAWLLIESRELLAIFSKGYTTARAHDREARNPSF